MNNTLNTRVREPLILRAESAADLMTPNPVSIRDTASVQEAIALLIDKGISAAPVIDGTGRAVGVVSQTDILVHDREKAGHPEPVPDYYERENLSARPGERSPKGLPVEKADPTVVRDIMTPIIFAVAPDSSAARTVDQMVTLKVHRVFVVDPSGVLVGVVSALDVLQKLLP
jgi:CBS-domain-containing membrane protein